MSKQISALLPDDVAEMLKREQNGRSVNVTVVEALRAYWTRRTARETDALERDMYLHGLGMSHPFDPSHANCIGCQPPVYGSIPADRKANA